jgi:hypothetical protein
MWKSGKANEKIKNNSICVLINGQYIRNMNYIKDINEQLVFVSNIARVCNYQEFTIEQGELCRYKNIIVTEKQEINLE